jgi:hypothetical protein
MFSEILVKILRLLSLWNGTIYPRSVSNLSSTSGETLQSWIIRIQQLYGDTTGPSDPALSPSTVNQQRSLPFSSPSCEHRVGERRSESGVASSTNRIAIRLNQQEYLPWIPASLSQTRGGCQGAGWRDGMNAHPYHHPAGGRDTFPSEDHGIRPVNRNAWWKVFGRIQRILLFPDS